MFRILAAAVVLAVLLTGCSGEGEEQVADDLTGATDYEPWVASAAPVEQGVLRDRIIGSGIIEGIREAVIRSRSAGTIRSISFELGGSYHEGDVLITLDDTIAQLNLRQLELQFETSLRDVESKEELFRRGGLSQTQLNQARASLDGLESQLEQAREAVSAAQITTPISGRIAEKSPNLVIGDQIQAGVQVGRIVDLESLRIVLSVGQNQVFALREGYPAEIRIRAPQGTITAEGTVRAVSAGSDRRTGSWQVVVEAPNPEPGLLRAGLSADVVIFNKDAPVQTLVPNGSLVYRDGSVGVFVVEDGAARLVPVEVLDQYGEQTALRSLDSTISLEGASVLVSGLARLRSGDPTVIRQ